MADHMTPHERTNPEEKQYRAMALEYETRGGEGESRIPVAISSETKVLRYDWYTDERYYEVLDHSAGSVDLSYARDGLPFLLDHDGRVQVGIVDQPQLDGDRKLRGFVRMGNHPDAGWVEKDIRAGVRKKVSVGYRLGDYTVDGEEGGIPVRRYHWMPVEVSSVPIPADYEVGVNRAAKSAMDAVVIPIRFEIDQDSLTEAKRVASDAALELAPKASAGRTVPAEVRDKQDPHAPRGKENTMSEQANTDGAAPATGVGAVGTDHRKVAEDIMRLCIASDAADKAPEFLSRGFTVDQAKAALFDAKVADARKVPAAGHLDLSEREAAQFNMNRAIMAIATKRWEEDGGFEKEVSDTIAKRLNKSTAGFLIPLDLKIRASATGNIVGTSSLGGAGVQTSVLSLIDILRNKMLVRQLGATVLSGLTGSITFPRQITANSLSWTGENPSSGNSNSAATLDNVALSPKTAMVSSAYSRQLLVQSSFDAAAFVQNDMSQVAALGLDLAALDGTGANSQPTGIMRQTGVTVITHTGSAGGIPTFAEMVSYETNVASSNADIGTMAFATTPGLRGKLKTTLKSTTAGSAYIWESDNTINGYRAEVTSQIPSNYTFGTSTTVAHGVVFGVWSELLIGEWNGAMEVIVDPYTLASQNMIQIHQVLLVDIAVRYPKAFAITKSALIA